MVRPRLHVSSISSFFFCVFISSFFVSSLVSLPSPRPDQIEILLSFKNEFPILKCDFRKWPFSNNDDSWTSKDVKSFDGVEFDNETGVVTKLDLRGACLSGSLSANSSLFRLHHLRYLQLSDNYFDSSFLPEFGNLTNLEFLSLSNNHFSGNIPCSLLTMPFLSEIYLIQNHLIGSLDTMNCSSSSKLETLYLSYNRLSGRILEPLSKLTNLKTLALSNQNTTDPINFVSSLGFKSLEGLDVSGNAVSQLSIGSPNLRMLYLDNCSINEFPTFIKNLPKLEVLSIGNNRLKGEVPKWLWNIPLSLCNQSYLLLLDLSHNNFSGSIPGCLFTSAVVGLNLRNNNLIGRFPDIFDKNGSLRAVDVSHNQITGQLPRSLTNLKNLEILNVEGNRIADTFPFWLKGLPNLKIIVLRSNKFHGPIYAPQHHLSFPQLRMIDISRNKFTGSLPHDYFVNWSEPLISVPQGQEEREPLYIPESLGLLKSLIVLNLSNNDFTGHIPSSWAKLTKLESLDLSRNQLTGKIPQELATLSFLEYVNVSHNKLTGQIPQGTQMGGQPKSSFEGNLNLCGPPLEESCSGDKAPSTPEAQEPESSEKGQVLNWKAAAMGYGPGVLFGLAIGQVFYSYKPVLLYKLFRL
ncbi:unnamed protein product [Brassica oleracea var. botrytis]